ncbi:MAG: hypothetical protein J6U22_02935 [Bacteroidaceae bacterium]|nr:hypothetical protein [Bacteroidaceae bacterium]
MKYYIPIHRDNIDNVITAEAISPADYYVVRGYGYSSFKTLKGIPSNQVVYLSNSLSLIKDDLISEEQICYIEIDDIYLRKDVDVYSIEGGIAVEGTVDLYPWSCRFLFLTEESLYQTVMICRTSLCNKMWGYYHFSLIEGKLKPYKELLCPETIIPDRIIKNEAQNNRLKGFLFAYTLGRFISIPQTIANLLQIERRMYDIATTISGLQNYEKDIFLKQLYNLEDQFEKSDPIRAEIQKQWLIMIESRFTGKANQLAFESVVRELGAEELMKSNFANKMGYRVRLRPQMTLARYIDWENYKKSIEDYTQSQIQSYRLCNGNTNTADDFKISGMNIIMNPKYGHYYSRLLSTIIDGLNWCNLDYLRLHRLEFASEITLIARDLMIESGQIWEGSEVRTFMNDLRQHIASGVPFDVSKAPDVILKSLAIFVLKGDDCEEMLRFMENNALGDYRFVLGLWGVCLGYTDIPKTIIQRMRLDNQGLSRIYLSTMHYLAEIPDDYSMKVQIYQFKNLTQTNTTNDRLNTVLKDKSIGLTKVQKTALLELWKESNGKASDSFFEKLYNVKGVGKVKLGKIKEILSPNEAISEKVQLDLFEQKHIVSRRFDLTAWQYIEPFIPNDPIVRKKVKEDLRWFISRRRKSETNGSLLANYKEHLQQKAIRGNSRYYWTADYFGRLDIDSIIKQLEKTYL